MQVNNSLNPKVTEEIGKLSENIVKVTKSLGAGNKQCNERFTRLEENFITELNKIETICESRTKNISQVNCIKDDFQEKLSRTDDRMTTLEADIKSIGQRNDVIQSTSEKSFRIEGAVIKDLSDRISALEKNLIKNNDENFINKSKINSEIESNAVRIKSLERVLTKEIENLNDGSSSPKTPPPYLKPPHSQLLDFTKHANSSINVEGHNIHRPEAIYRQQWGDTPVESMYRPNDNIGYNTHSRLPGEGFSNFPHSGPTMRGSSKFFELYKKENHTFNGENKPLAIFLKEAEELMLLTGMSEPQFLYYFPHLLYGKAKDWWDLSNDPMYSWEEVKERMASYYGTEYHRGMRKSQWHNLEFLHCTDIENFTLQALKLQRELKPSDDLWKRLERIILKMPYALRDFLLNKDPTSEEEFLYLAKEAMRLKGQGIKFHSNRNCDKIHYPSQKFANRGKGDGNWTNNSRNNDKNNYNGYTSDSRYDKDNHNYSDDENNRKKWRNNDHKDQYNSDSHQKKSNGDNNRSYYNRNHYKSDAEGQRNYNRHNGNRGSDNQGRSKDKVISSLTVWKPGKLELDGYRFRNVAEMMLYQQRLAQEMQTQPSTSPSNIGN